jgi:NTE family protein
VLGGLAESGLLPEAGFELLVGSSAGAINAAFLAAHASELPASVARLEDLWSTIEPQHIFRTDLRSLGGIGMRWVRDLSFGGMLRRTGAKSLLDTAPLREFLLAAIPFDRIDDHIGAGRLRALAIPATDLYTSDGVVFLDAQSDVPLWERGRWSIEIEGRHLGDGSVRNTAPLSPAINLGADRIVAIGVRQPTPVTYRMKHGKPPSIAQVAATLLDAVMLDAIGIDVEHSGRVNTSVIAATDEHPGRAFRWIDVLWLSPTRHFSEIAREFAHRIPPILRYLMRGLGTDEETTELASYLLFDAEFCRRLVELGRRDVAARSESIRAFFAGSGSSTPASSASRNGF